MKLKLLLVWIAAIALASVGVACDGDDDDGNTDAGADTGMDDTGMDDTGTDDSGTDTVDDTGTDTVDDTGTDTGMDPMTNIRVLHASTVADGATAGGVDIYTGETSVTTALVYPESTEFLQVAAGDYAFDVFATGADPMTDAAALEIPSLTYDEDVYYTLIAHDDDGGIGGLRLEDDATAPADGNIRLRVVHAGDGIPDVNVWNITDAENPAPLVTGVSFGAASDYVEVPSAAYELGVDVGPDFDDVPDATYSVPQLESGTIANVVAVNEAGTVVLFAQLWDGTVARIDPNVEEDAASIRVAHLSADAPAVDVYVAGTTDPVVDALAYGDMPTGYLEVPAGDYDFDVFVDGDDPSTDTPAIDIDGAMLEAGGFYTVYAYGSAVGGTLTYGVVADDRSDVDAGMIRVNAIHTAAGVGTVDIWDVTDPENPAPVYPGLAHGTAGGHAMLAADTAVVLGLDTNADGYPEYEFDVPGLAEGTNVALFAALDDDGVALLADLDAGDGTMTRLDGVGMTYARVAHGLDLVAGVDVYVGGTTADPVVTNLDFQEATGFLAVEAGAYAFDVYGTGTDASANDPALPIPELEYAVGGLYTLVAYNNGGAVAGLRIEEDFTDIPDTGARVHVVHIAEAADGVDVYNTADTSAALVPDFVFGTDGTLDLDPTGALTLGFDLNDDPSDFDLTFDVSPPAGESTTVYAVADGAAIDLLLHLEDGSFAVVEAN